MDLEKKIKELISDNMKVNNGLMELLTYFHNNGPKKSISMTDKDFNIMDAIYSDLWPEAVNKHLIINKSDNQEKKDRGEGIVQIYLDENLDNKKFLDYGCGEGHVVEAASGSSIFSIGYDIKPSESWDTINCTTDWNQVVQNGPYDVVLIFDVLDHLINENPIDVLKKIKNITAKNGSVYVRFHPITSRCATHSYHALNKAYLHLVLNHDQMIKLIPNEEDYIINNGPTRPLKTYEEYIREAGFLIEQRNEITEKPEEFFKNNNISSLIKEATGFDEFPEFQMSLNFVDYKLINK